MSTGAPESNDRPGSGDQGARATVAIRDVEILTMDSDRTVIPSGHVLVSGDRITAVASDEPDPGRIGPRTEIVDGKGGLLIPGLISTHQHVIDVLLRGLSQERDLLDWSINVYYPGTTAYTPDDVGLAVTLAMDEALRAGVTTVVDNWSASLDPVLARESADAALGAYQRLGTRVVFARMFADAMPPSWSPLVRHLGGSADHWVEDTDQALGDIEELMGRWNGAADGRISVCPSPTTAHTVTAKGMVEAQRLAQRNRAILPIHHCETRIEASMYPESGAGPSTTDYLNRLGVLGPDLLAAHCVWMEERDIRLLAEASCSVAHCPTSNMLLASGIAPVAALRRAGVTVALGCDNAMVNNNVSLLGEIRLAALLAKVATLDAGAVTAMEALTMATQHGASAIGRGHDLGSIEAGKKADLALLDRSGPHWVPCHDPAAAVVYQAHVDDVRTVIVDGQVLLRDRTSTRTPDADSLYRMAAARAGEIVEAADLGHLLHRPRPV